MIVQSVSSIQEVGAKDWDRLAGTGNPFVRHAFLGALENNGCLGEQFGWLPRHLLVTVQGRPVGAAPLYLKDNSYGEFVFDWAWAEAYARAGLPYYPKLVCAVPYTPVTGPRLLVDPLADTTAVTAALVRGSLERADEDETSSIHWLFTGEGATASLESHQLSRRVGCQYHWHNPGYRDFEDFLDAFTSKRRKAIKRERRQVREAGVELELRNGHEMGPAQWQAVHDFYRSTFDRKWGVATLNLPFFEEIGANMPEAVLVVLARQGRHYVGAAFNLLGSEALYGRHWGTDTFIPGLHFEVCYYQAIEFCIARGLRRFEAGAQGEHKIARGFHPTPTYSAHWIRHPAFRRAVADFLARERAAMDEHIRQLTARLPFRDDALVRSAMATPPAMV